MSLSHSPQLVTNGLVMCLDAADPKSYPGSGTTWFDRSGNGNNGTLNAGVTHSSSQMIFDGINGYVDTSYVPNFDEGTIDVWFNFDVLRNYNTVFDNDLDANSWEQWVYSSGIMRFRTSNNQADIIVDGNVTMAAGVWYNTTLTWSLTEGRQYINGVLGYSDAALPANRFTPLSLKIGGGSAGNTKFGGKIPIFRVYNRELTATEIKQNHNATKGRFGL